MSAPLTMVIKLDDARLIRAALIALEHEALSSEPHYAHTPEFRRLQRNVSEFISGLEADAKQKPHDL